MKIEKGFSLKSDAPDVKAKKVEGQLRDASQMYENYFLNEMVKAMRSTVNREDGLMKPSFAEKIFEGQLDQQYVENWAKKGGVGLADMIYTQINDKFMAGQKAGNGKSFNIKGGMMPISPKKDPIGIPSSDSIQMKAIPPGPEAKMEYRFEVPNPSGQFEVQAPLKGRIVAAKTLGEGWQSVKLDHGQGLESELTFPGTLPEIGTGIDVEAGQSLGQLDGGRPVLAWKLDWV